MAGYANRGQRPRRSLNQILTGNQLTKLLTVPLVGYVAQLVSAGTKYASLEGNVFGQCVGTLVSSNICGPWQNEKGTLIPTGSPEGTNIVGLNASRTAESQDKSWRMIVYKTVPGAFEGSTEEDDSSIATLLKETKAKILHTFEP